jgi:hypothetical protein
VRRAFALAAAASLALSGSVRAQEFDLSRLELPSGFLDLADVTLNTRSDRTITATATATLLGAPTFVLVSSTPASAARRGFILGLKPDDWSFGRIPALDVAPFNQLTLSNVGLVLTDQDIRASSDLLPGEDYEFYRELYQADDYELVLKPGINLIAAIPVDRLEEGHPLRVIMNALGIESGTVLLQGTLGKSLGLIGAGGGGAGIVKDLFLRAELPPMRPPGSPEWFVNGKIALELSGLPSAAVAGEMTVLIDDDQLTFRVAATLARTGMTLSGGLLADEDGWVAPFGIEWLTINKVVLLLGITPTGSVQLGFAGDAVFGEKDVAVAVAIAVSPAGVPTNFMMQGESQAGVALSDIATVQEKMARAAGRDDPRIPLDALPDVAITDLALKFAPKPQPELGIERGMAIKGRLWLQTTPNGELTDFAGVDVNVGDEGFWVRGDIGAFQLGPLALEETKLDLTATREEQRFMLKGAAELLGARQSLDIEVLRSGLSFRSETELWELFHGLVEARAAFDLRNPSFQVHAEMQNDFADVIAPFITGGLQSFAASGEALLAGTDSVLAGLDRILADREADVERIRDALLVLRAQADAAFAQARAVALEAQRVAAGTRAAADAARNTFYATPAGLRYTGLRAQRRAQWVALEARWRVQVAFANGTLAVVAVRQRIVDVLPSIEENVLLLAAQEALAAARDRVETARTNLAALEQRYAQVVAAIEDGVLPLTVERAVFDASLAGLNAGGAAQWSISGTFLGRPFTLERSLDFSNVGAATADLLQGLIG